MEELSTKNALSKRQKGTSLLVLVHEYGFGLEQIAEEEEVTRRGFCKPRANFVT